MMRLFLDWMMQKGLRPLRVVVSETHVFCSAIPTLLRNLIFFGICVVVLWILIVLGAAYVCYWWTHSVVWAWFGAVLFNIILMGFFTLRIAHVLNKKCFPETKSYVRCVCQCAECKR